MITLRQIQFALAVARHHHFKKAAEECYVSQSALSLGISELEKNLGVVIFERNNKQVVITPRGREILARGQKLYLDAQQLIESAQISKDDLSYNMQLGFIPTIAPFLLPKALPIIREKYPKFDFEISEETTERLLSEVRQGRLDAAIIALPYPIAGLQVIEFFEEKFNLAIHKNQPFASKNSVSSKDLTDVQLLLLGEGHCLSDHILSVCHMRDKIDQSFFKNASLNTLIQLTANDMGATLVPDIALSQLNTYSTIKTIPLNEPGPHRKLAIVTRDNYPRQQDLRRLSQLFTQSLTG